MEKSKTLLLVTKDVMMGVNPDRFVDMHHEDAIAYLQERVAKFTKKDKKEDVDTLIISMVTSFNLPEKKRTSAKTASAKIPVEVPVEIPDNVETTK